MSQQILTEISYERRGPAGWVTLNRPSKRNALTPTLVAELGVALDEAEGDAEVRALVITGAGSAFCAGADLGVFETMLGEQDGCDRFTATLLEPLRLFLERIRRSALPVVAAVNGACAAGGLEMILCCDVILASSNATFSDAHSRRGLTPALGGVAGLVNALGIHRAKQMLMFGETYDASTMAAWGLVAEVIDEESFSTAVGERVATLTRRSPASLALMKRMVERSREPGWSAQVAWDLDDFAQLWRGPDLAEGLRAYHERREPRFVR